MGNVHALAHRLTAMSVACLASVGFIFCFLSGMSCHYLDVNPEPDRVVMTPDGIEYEDGTSASIGVQCDSSFHTDDDRMWNLSRLFFFLSLGIGGLTTLLAWTVSVLIPPSNVTWRAISILAACAAVFEVPIFLIYESVPCNMDIGRQTCSIGVGAYLNMVGIAVFVILTLWTQCLRPPDWTKETDAWRRNPDRDVKVGEITIPSGADDSRDENGTEEESMPRDFSRGSPPKSPPYWSIQPKRPEPVPVSESRIEKEQPVPEPDELVDEPDDDGNRLFHHIDVASTGEHSSGARWLTTADEEQEGKGTGKGLFFWRKGRGNNTSKEQQPVPSSWGLNGRPRPNAEGKDDEETGEAETTMSPVSHFRGMQPIHNEDEQLEVVFHDDTGNMDRPDQNELHVVHSLFDTETQDDDETEVSPQPNLSTRQDVVNDAGRKSAAVGTKSVRNNYWLPYSRKKSKEEPPGQDRVLKLSIICPDGRIEKSKVGGGKSGVETIEPQPMRSVDDTVEPQNFPTLKSQDSWPSNPPSRVPSRMEESDANMGPRDFIVTHSIPRSNRGSNTRQEEKPIVSRKAQKSAMRFRTASEEKDAMPLSYPLSSYHRNNVELRSSKELNEVPLSSLSFRGPTRSVSYDVSEMTPGPEIKHHPDDALAILEDLAKLEA